jgi:Gas vesicle synthesis protein GvpL/GvpF
MSAVVTNTAWYAYGVVAAERGAGVPPVAAGVELRVIDAGNLAVVSSSVTLDEFGEEPLRANLNDREWLERHARLHEDVLLAVAAATDVVPFRFGTICNTAADLRALVGVREEALLASLERVRGRIELGIKLWVDEARLAAALEPDAGAAPSSGRAYLEARRAEQRRAADADAVVAEVACDAYLRLSAVAADGVVNRPQPRELTGRDERMLLNAAFLVESGDARLRDEAARLDAELRERGFSIELTGPWPPHNFVDEQQEQA